MVNSNGDSGGGGGGGGDSGGNGDGCSVNNGIDDVVNSSNDNNEDINKCDNTTTLFIKLFLIKHYQNMIQKVHNAYSYLELQECCYDSFGNGNDKLEYIKKCIYNVHVYAIENKMEVYMHFVNLLSKAMNVKTIKDLERNFNIDQWIDLFVNKDDDDDDDEEKKTKGEEENERGKTGMERKNENGKLVLNIENLDIFYKHVNTSKGNIFENL